MEFDELLISTGVDALIKLVHDRKKIELEEAAKELDMPFSSIEAWAQALEDEGIIRIDYQFTKVYLSWIKGAEGKILEKLGDVTTQKENLKQMITSIKKRIEEKNKELDDVEKDYKKIISLFDPKILEIQEKTKKMEIISRTAEDKMQAHQSKLEDLKTDLTSFSEHLIKKENEWKKLYENISNNQIKGLNEIRFAELKIKETLENSLKKIDELTKKLEEQKQTYKHFENVEAQIKSTEKEMNSIKEMVNQTKNEIQDIIESQKEIKQNLKNGSFEKTKQELTNIQGTLPEIKKQIEQNQTNIEKQLSILDKLEKKYNKFETKEGKIIFEVLQKRQEIFENNINQLEKIIKNIEESKKLKPDIKKKTKEVESLLSEVNTQKETLIETSTKITKELDTILKPLNEFEAKYTQLKGTVLFYSKRMNSLEKEYLNQKEEITNEQEKINSELTKYHKEIREEIENMNKTIEKYNSIIQDKNEIDKIFQKIREIREMKNKVVTDLELLNKKVDLVKISKKGDKLEVSETIRDIGEKIELNKTEEKILQKKRQELRDLIKSMWEN